MQEVQMTLATDDWPAVIEGVPELGALSNVKDQFKVITFPRGGDVRTDGLYVVVEGQVSLRLKGEEVGKALKHDYFFEEYLAVEGVSLQLEAYALPGTRLMKLNHSNWRTLPSNYRTILNSFMFGDLVNVHMHDFQQPINCCNVTAAAFGLTALGYPTHVDDIFRDCSLPAAYVVNTGMTLGEMFDIACSYVHRRGLKNEVDVQCHFFDQELVSEQDFADAISESDLVGGEHDILVANFGVGIAHDEPGLGGGHFALIAKCNPSTHIVHMVDVHPEKYGKLWVTNINRLYRAMTERDGSSLRARGILRFSARHAADTRLGTFDHPVHPVDLSDHLDIDQGRITSFFEREMPNLNSLGTLALAIRLITGSRITTDELMRTAGIQYSEALSSGDTAQTLARALAGYLTDTGTGELNSELHAYAGSIASRNQSTFDWFLGQLGELSGDNSRLLMLSVDINKVIGCNAVLQPASSQVETARLREHWCIATHYDPETQTVTIADISPATSRVWQTSAGRLFQGIDSPTEPSVLVISQGRDHDIAQIVTRHPLTLFIDDDDADSYMLQSMLSNIGVTDLHIVDLSGNADHVLRQKQQLIKDSGKDSVPYLYHNGNCMGETEVIVELIRQGTFQERLRAQGLNVLMKTETPSLDKNIYGYPKGGLTDAPDERKNILVCCCGSSAADKIPELIENLVAAGHDVKLVPSKPAEHFFRDMKPTEQAPGPVGMERIMSTLRPSDIYRDDDEWNFRYEEFGMPVRACHLALCDWADCMVVAPITCNTMGKAANGVADSLLTSVFVAWQYQKKPVILAPACNTNMWNNLTTQNNVAQLKRLGAHFEGPKSGMLSNGTMGTGMMATIDEISSAVLDALEDLENQEARVMRWGAQAAAADDRREWDRIFRCIDEDIVGVNVRSDDTGDTLLHYAAGGEGEMLEHGIEKGVPDLEAARDLIARGIDVDTRNDYGFTALHVAIMNDAPEMVSLLLDAGADATDCVGFVQARSVVPAVTELIVNWAVARGIEVPEQAPPEAEAPEAQDTALYFTYGSLKRGFPNHDDHADILREFVGTAVTRQSLPLIVPHEANCTNPNCPWLHRMPALVNKQGKGKPVRGEVYRVPANRLKELDHLETYKGPEHPENVYNRKTISVEINGEVVKVQAYFIADPRPQLAAWENGEADAVAEYTPEMAAVVPKPK